MKGNSPLKEWGEQIEARSGAKKAKVALARKLAVIMHQMLVSGEEFRAAAAAAVPAAASFPELHKDEPTKVQQASLTATPGSFRGTRSRGESP